MKNLDCSEYDDLESRYGPPIQRCGMNSIRVNQSYFAGLLLHESPLHFVGKQWHTYYDKCWRPVPDTVISTLIAELIRHVAAELECPDLLVLITSGLVQAIEKIARGMAHIESFPAMDWRIIPCRNTVLRWNAAKGEFVREAFAPEQNIRSLLTVDYDPDASYDDFKQTVLDEVLDPEDQFLLQRYLGIALLPVNLTENFLLLQGVGGSSKSLLVRLLVEILGDQRVFDLDIKALGGDYALSGLDGQTLLVASESAGDALCSSGASFIKKIVGGDKIQTRLKYLNEKRQLCGNYSLIIVTNAQTIFHYVGNGGEWRRRVLPVFFPKPHEKVVKGLIHQLLVQHGSGILNWLLEGAADVLRNGWQIDLSPEQEIRRERLIARSEPVRLFVETCVELSAGDDFTSEEAYQHYCKVGREGNLPVLGPEAFYKQLAIKMPEVFPGIVRSNNLRRRGAGQDKQTCRGYRGYKLKEVARA